MHILVRTRGSLVHSRVHGHPHIQTEIVAQLTIEEVMPRNSASADIFSVYRARGTVAITDGWNLALKELAERFVCAARRDS